MSDFSTRPRTDGRSAAAVLIALSACVLLVSLGSAWREWTWRGHVRESVDGSRRELADLQERVRALQSERVTDDEARLASQLVLNGSAPPAATMAALERVLPADVRLEGLTVTYGSGIEIEMRDVARRASA
jgi:hypothetical protein